MAKQGSATSLYFYFSAQYMHGHKKMNCDMTPGSSLFNSTIAPVLSEGLELRELPEALLGSEGRRRLALNHKTKL